MRPKLECVRKVSWQAVAAVGLLIGCAWASACSMPASQNGAAPWVREARSGVALFFVFRPSDCTVGMAPFDTLRALSKSGVASVRAVMIAAPKSRREAAVVRQAFSTAIDIESDTTREWERALRAKGVLPPAMILVQDGRVSIITTWFAQDAASSLLARVAGGNKRLTQLLDREARHQTSAIARIAGVRLLSEVPAAAVSSLAVSGRATSYLAESGWVPLRAGSAALQPVAVQGQVVAAGGRVVIVRRGATVAEQWSASFQPLPSLVLPERARAAWVTSDSAVVWLEEETASTTYRVRSRAGVALENGTALSGIEEFRRDFSLAVREDGRSFVRALRYQSVVLITDVVAGTTDTLVGPDSIPLADVVTIPAEAAGSVARIAPGAPEAYVDVAYARDLVVAIPAGHSRQARRALDVFRVTRGGSRFSHRLQLPFQAQRLFADGASVIIAEAPAVDGTVRVWRADLGRTAAQTCPASKCE